MAEAGNHDRKDWVGGFPSFSLAWGLPIAALIGAGFLDPVPKQMPFELTVDSHKEARVIDAFAVYSSSSPSKRKTVMPVIFPNRANIVNDQWNPRRL